MKTIYRFKIDDSAIREYKMASDSRYIFKSKTITRFKAQKRTVFEKMQGKGFTAARVLVAMGYISYNAPTK